MDLLYVDTLSDILQLFVENIGDKKQFYSSYCGKKHLLYRFYTYWTMCVTEKKSHTPSELNHFSNPV